MKNILEKYKALSSKHKFGIAFTIFVGALLFIPSIIVFIIGATASYKLIDKKVLKYATMSGFLALTFFSGILFIVDDKPTIESKNDIRTIKNVPQSKQTNIITNDESASNLEKDVEKVSEKQTVTTDNSTVNQANTEQQETAIEDKSAIASYKVASVVDGDTVKLNIDGKTETIRLIGIDTPETVHPSKPVECFGIEASNKAKELLSGQVVSLETDSSQGTRGVYGRLLGYIILSDGTNFNKLMIEEGYAYEYTYSTAYKYQSSFKSAETYARTNGIGLWADGVCEEDTNQGGEPITTSGDKWYVSSHYSSKFYYCEESDDWKSLSEKYLRAYDSEALLLADFPNHTLHESCQ